MNLNLENKVYLISGSTRGIGFGIAKSFLSENACVAITGRDKESLKSAHEELSQDSDQKNILALNADMQDWEAINQQVDIVHKHFNRLDGIIANIGSGAEPQGFPSDPLIWETSYNKNVNASLQLVQASLPYLKQHGGSIVFISSIAGIEDIKAPIAYSMHKAALIAASKKLSRNLADHHIRVNVVAPGNIYFSGGGWERRRDQNPVKVDNFIKEEVPLNAFGSPEDIGNLCVYLSSDKAKFITGSLIIADGGQTRSF